jgi:hypothetical protein
MNTFTKECHSIIWWLHVLVYTLVHQCSFDSDVKIGIECTYISESKLILYKLFVPLFEIVFRYFDIFVSKSYTHRYSFA